MEDMVRYVYDLGDEKANGEKVCPAITEKDFKIKEGLTVVNELLNPKTKLTERDDTIYFNNEDIGEDIGIIIEAYVKGDFKAMGFVFANTLHKHSHYV
jgi:hypothetical protein